jgi:hypothetical protein
MSKWHEAQRNSTREATENAKKKKQKTESSFARGSAPQRYQPKKKEFREATKQQGRRGALKADSASPAPAAWAQL